MIAEGRRGKLLLVLRLARLHFLVPGFLLYILGFLLGTLRGGEANVALFLSGYSIFLTAHLSLHFSNDYFDREGDRMGRSNVLSGGSGVLGANPLLVGPAFFLSLALLLGSVALAGIFTLVYSFPPSFFAFAVGGALLGWFYSAPPIRFSSHRLSELTTSFAAGFIMPGMGYFVSLGGIDLWFVVLSLPLMCFAAFFIITVEMPDVESDRVSGKRNLLTEYGRRAGAVASLVVTSAGAILLLLMTAFGSGGGQNLFLVLATFSVIPIAGAASALFNRLGTPKEIYMQAKINLASLISFLLISDLYLLVTVAL